MTVDTLHPEGAPHFPYPHEKPQPVPVPLPRPALDPHERNRIDAEDSRFTARRDGNDRYSLGSDSDSWDEEGYAYG